MCQRRALVAIEGGGDKEAPVCIWLRSIALVRGDSSDGNRPDLGRRRHGVRHGSPSKLPGLPALTRRCTPHTHPRLDHLRSARRARRAGLKAVGFQRAAQSTGISGFIQRSGSDWTASAIVAEIVKWFIRLLAIQAAASILGLTQISQIVNAILLWLPNLVVAIVIVVIGTLIASS